MIAGDFWRAASVVAMGLMLGLAPFTVPVLEGQATGTAEAHLAQGIALLRAGNLPQARTELAKAVSLNPRSVEAHIYLGVVENELSNYLEAIPVFREALRLDSHSEAAHYNLSLSLLRLQKNDEAIQELQEVIRLNPKVAPAHYNLGLLLAQKGRYKDAVEHFEVARVGRPNDPAILIHLVNAYFRVGNEARALQLAEEGIQSDSRGDVAARLGVLLEEFEHYEKAVSALEKARASAPESPEMSAYLARAYLGAHRPKEAVAVLAPVRDQHPSWQASYLLGLAYIGTDQPDAALSALREAIRLKPDEAATHYNLGRLLLKSKDKAEQKTGVEEIQKAIDLAPRGSEYYITLSKWLLDQYELEPAINLLRRAIRSVEPSVELYLMLGLAEAELHGSAVARPFIEKAIELNPQVGPAFNLLGNCYLRIGDYENAAKYYKKAAELNSQNDIYFYDVALALDRLNKTAEAIPFAEKSTQLKPDRSFNHYMLGKLYAKVGRKTDAIRALETCVRLDPKIEYPYYLLARTYMQMGNQAKALEWSRKLQELKDTKDRRVGLTGHASESPRILEPEKPWATPQTSQPQPAGSSP